MKPWFKHKKTLVIPFFIAKPGFLSTDTSIVLDLSLFLQRELKETCQRKLEEKVLLILGRIIMPENILKFTILVLLANSLWNSHISQFWSSPEMLDLHQIFP